MTATLSIRVPHDLLQKLKNEAKRIGLSVEEYVLELIIRDLDPRERARRYIELARDLLKQAHSELNKGDVRQAAEKTWGAAALAVKAYAEWRDGARLSSHGELWEYTGKIIGELGEWVQDAWMNAVGMHICFYEGWCTRQHVEAALRRVKRLVSQVEKKVLGEPV